MSQIVELALVQGDIAEIPADVIVLKYAHTLYGADEYVAELLSRAGVPIDDLTPAEGKYAYVASHGAVAARHVLYLGVPRLSGFRYPQMREFSTAALRTLKNQAPSVSHLAMTIHGPGYGLDETESFFSLIQGFEDGLRSNEIPATLTRVTIVDKDLARIQRLQQALAASLDNFEGASPLPNGNIGFTLRPSVSTRESQQTSANNVNSGGATKPHIFVAMPFSTHLDDVFYYGIQTPLHNAGYLCERLDHSVFTGDIVETIKKSIETATAVIAEISDHNPNVYLEVGYAWGKNRPTILLAGVVDDLPFDVKGQRCLQYKGIKHLEELLTRELMELKVRSII